MFGWARSFWPVDMIRNNFTHFTRTPLRFDARQLTNNTYFLHVFVDNYLYISIGLSIYRAIYIPIGRSTYLSIYLSVSAPPPPRTVQPFGASEGGTLIRHQHTGRGADAPLRVLTLPHLQNARRFSIPLSHRGGPSAGGQ